MSEPVEVVLLGAGSRGRDALGAYCLRHPEVMKIVAVAELDEAKRNRLGDEHGIAPERRFASWEDLLGQPQLAPGLLNATMDRLHVPTTLAALKAGYHVLCEKPMAVSPHDCVRMVRAAEAADRRLQICHVLRYAAFWQTVKRTLESGRLGQVVHCEHSENIAWWHQAHSFVRGNWGVVGQSAPIVLAKCCHDLDLLVWQFGTSLKVSSFGALSHLRPEHAPDGAGERCLDCRVEADCPYSAVRLYLNDKDGWPQNHVAIEPTIEARRAALANGPYGRCVYHCDNDNVDHQLVNIEFAGGVMVNFSLNGQSHENCRTVRYGGSHGTLRGHEGRAELELHRYHPSENETLAIESTGGSHGGGDEGVMGDFAATLREPHREVLTSARASVESHLIAFAAEESRRLNTVIDMTDYRARIEREVAAEEAGS